MTKTDLALMLLQIAATIGAAETGGATAIVLTDLISVGKAYNAALTAIKAQEGLAIDENLVPIELPI